MTFRLFENGHKAYTLFLIICPFLLLIEIFMLLKGGMGSKIVTVLYLLAIVITVQAAIASFMQRKKASEVTLMFVEGYFVLTHKAYKLIFTPKAIDEIVTKKKGGFTHLLIVLHPSKVEVSGSDKVFTTLNFKMTNDEYTNGFRVFYEGATQEEGVTTNTTFNQTHTITPDQITESPSQQTNDSTEKTSFLSKFVKKEGQKVKKEKKIKVKKEKKTKNVTPEPKEL